MDLPVLVANGVQVAACIKVEDFISLAGTFTCQLILQDQLAVISITVYQTSDTTYVTSSPS